MRGAWRICARRVLFLTSNLAKWRFLYAGGKLNAALTRAVSDRCASEASEAEDKEGINEQGSENRLEFTERFWPTAKGLFGVGSWREFVGLGLAFRYYVHAEQETHTRRRRLRH